ncbi:MAG: hypothetical protein AB7O62_14785 [Pirellulales bacterium]
MVLLLAAVLFSGGTAAAEKSDWLTGPAAVKALDGETSLSWQGNPLRDGLRKLCDAHRVSLLVDRRVDPDQEVTISIRDAALREALERIAQDRRVGLSQFGPVSYVGPKPAAERLRTLALLRKQDVSGLPAAARKPLLRTRPWQWDDLATPRQLLQDLADEADVKIHNAENLPHDLWAAADLAPLSWIDRLTLLLVQFDATFEMSPSGREANIIGLPESIAIERSFPGGPKPDELAAQWGKMLPNCQVKVVDRKLLVRGYVEDLERIESNKQGSGTRTKVTGTKEVRYTLTIQKQPLGSVLKQIADQAKVDLKFDDAAIEAAGIKLDQRISAAVEDASLDELFEALLTPAKLAFRREAAAVEIFPAE